MRASASTTVPLFALITVIFFLMPLARGDQIQVQSGEKVAFLGDSITANGAATPSGYVRLVESALAANGIQITPIKAGVSGNTSKDMLARLDRDVINSKPDWVTISCGVNDVWHAVNGVPLPDYKTNMTEMVNRCKDAGIKVMLLTSTPIGEDLSNANNKKLEAYNDFLRALAKQDHLLLADLNACVQSELKKQLAGPHSVGNLLTVDGVHMNPLGNEAMASGILRAFGLNDDQIKMAQEKWLDIPAACDVPGKASITIRQYQQLDALATKQHSSVQNILNDALTQTVARLLDGQSAGQHE